MSPGPRSYKSKAALLLGVNDPGANLTGLRHCERDIQALGQILRGDKFDVTVIPDVGSLTSDPPTSQKIIEKIKKIANPENNPAEGRRLFLFHFSGHGTCHINTNEQHLYCAYDPRMAHIISISEIQKLLMLNDRLDYLLIVDACRSGTPDGDRDIASPPQQLVVEHHANACRVTFFATSKTQSAVESGRLQMGIFSAHVCRALENKARFERAITWKSLYSNVMESMGNEWIRQVPDSVGTQEDFVIIDDCKPVQPALINLGSLSKRDIKTLVEQKRFLFMHKPILSASQSDLDYYYYQLQAMLTVEEPMMTRILALIHAAYRDYIEIGVSTEEKIYRAAIFPKLLQGEQE